MIFSISRLIVGITAITFLSNFLGHAVPSPYINLIRIKSGLGRITR